ncbi:MAG: hypothetical protein JRI85_16340 [Deltaproteobacteria bacterium]|nr:hypothetical protein [Deltaproteobacteria bacterium]
MPDSEKAKILSNYFDKKVADNEFWALPRKEQDRIRGNFLESQGISFFLLYDELARRIHAKYFSDMPYNDF